jgi:hypothetical protein
MRDYFESLLFQAGYSFISRNLRIIRAAAHDLEVDDFFYYTVTHGDSLNPYEKASYRGLTDQEVVEIGGYTLSLVMDQLEKDLRKRGLNPNIGNFRDFNKRPSVNYNNNLQQSLTI